MTPIYPIERYANLLAEAVNRRVGSKVSDITYRATAERVSGLAEIARNAGLYIYRCLKENPQKAYEIRLDPSEFLQAISSDFRIFSIEYDVFDKSAGRLRKALVPYFVYANKEGVESDDSFKKAVFDYLRGCKGSVIRKVRNSKLELVSNCYSFFENAIPYMAQLDWEAELSSQAYNRRVFERVSPNFSFEKMLEKGNREDPLYRRRVLFGWIAGYDIGSYEQALDSINRMTENRRERFERLKRLNAPKYIIENEEQMLKNAELLRHTLVSEEEAVKRFLQR
ncbi:MAG: hypothetical protein Q8N99_04325 [Nanoarchaeota archaeon]|nr:hypothetical protein [Nanoarchaeota archaeon]